MIKTELFSGSKVLDGVFKYKAFIKENQGIEIISVNVLEGDFVLLTYKSD